jgi:hypothetical protein
MDRQIRRLEIELQKFKSDLEGKQPGICEQLLQGQRMYERSRCVCVCVVVRWWWGRGG